PGDFIRARLPVLPVPGIPEIVLHKAVPASGLGRLAAADDGFGSPYWAYYWLGGLALARFVLDRPETVAGKRVLDLGTGSGLVAIAAAKAGAAS
ncbi:methyltransferase, partial [Escherichia coli]|nr:methyltransferase [Escherichia coli]